MSIRERLERLDDRERRLLGVALGIALLGVVLLPPAALFAILHSRRSEVDSVREAIAEIEDSSTVIERAKAEKHAIAERYARQAPQLQAFLASLASQSSVEIPESQDRQAVPRGKRFEERSTKVTLRKVGMLKLVKFLEKIEQSGYPVKITQINVRKRGSEPDSYDVDLVVSAFDRKAAPEPKAGTVDAGAPAASAKAENGAADEEEEEP
jgi:general secretion pathway protein M